MVSPLRFVVPFDSRRWAEAVIRDDDHPGFVDDTVQPDGFEVSPVGGIAEVDQGDGQQHPQHDQDGAFYLDRHQYPLLQTPEPHRGQLARLDTDDSHRQQQPDRNPDHRQKHVVIDTRHDAPTFPAQRPAMVLLPHLLPSTDIRAHGR